MALQDDIAARFTSWRDIVTGWYRRAADAIVNARFPYRLSSVGWHILLVNVVGLVVLLVGIFFVRSTEAWLIDAKRDALNTQGRLIAAAIAGKATSSGGEIAFDPDELVPAGARALGPAEDLLAGLEFEIRPQAIARILKRLVELANTRARIYTANGEQILDSDYLESLEQVRRRRLPPPGETDPSAEFSVAGWLASLVRPSDLPVYRDIGGANGKAYPEFDEALGGQTTTMLVQNERGREMVTVVVPIQRMSRIIGVLMLSTRGNEISTLLRKERQSITFVAVLTAAAMLLLSALLAAAISLPLHRLSAASERVRANLNSRESLPDYTHRADEIGKLSGTLREMTDALYRRLEASERFAADVAHELKNPLTSVRSAAELLPIVKTDAHRHELSETIQHDVKRLTRLIDDISNATRIDAEMGRSSTTPVNLGDVLSTIRDMFNDTWRERDRSVTLSIEPSAPCIVHGHETRLAQVATNLVDNALSFSPEGEAVKIRLSQQGAVYRIEVCDAGPGIPEESLENIFHRFYTDRPGGAESFGNNSGLGLSIARDIVEAHNGRLWAENQYEAASASGGGDTERSEEKSVLGARFVVELPVAEAARRGGSRRG